MEDKQIIELYFARNESAIAETYSYFSLTPYGYANIFPLITAVMTCVLLLLLIISIIFKKDLGKSAAIISGIASALSLCPLPLFGADEFTAIGAAISICLIAGAAVCFLQDR
jgi:hypothetical protein